VQKKIRNKKMQLFYDKTTKEKFTTERTQKNLLELINYTLNLILTYWNKEQITTEERDEQLLFWKTMIEKNYMDNARSTKVWNKAKRIKDGIYNVLEPLEEEEEN